MHILARWKHYKSKRQTFFCWINKIFKIFILQKGACLSKSEGQINHFLYFNFISVDDSKMASLFRKTLRNEPFFRTHLKKLNDFWRLKETKYVNKRRRFLKDRTSPSLLFTGRQSTQFFCLFKIFVAKLLWTLGRRLTLMLGVGGIFGLSYILVLTAVQVIFICHLSSVIYSCEIFYVFSVYKFLFLICNLWQSP